MKRHTVTGRGRTLVALAAVAGLSTGAVAVTTGPAGSAEPTGDCAVAYPVAELVSGQAVTGLTVTRGTTPEGFTGEVLGVLDDGVAAGVDMVMVRLTSPEIDRVGIWQGMSGSPVYAADGRLIGAVAYGLSQGRSSVAGVTPYAEMDDYLAAGGPARTVEVPRTAARAIARGTGVSATRAAEGFTQLPMPVGVTGVTGRQLTAAAERAGKRTWLPAATRSVGKAGAGVAGPADIVAGGNLAASMAYGDVTMAAIGTATSVCGDRVVGLGHPVEYLGRTTLAMHPASAVYVQEDLLAGFKLANLGAPVGTITDDRLTGITGAFGATPDTATVTSTLTSGSRSRTGVSEVALRTGDPLASTTFFGLLANHNRVVDGPAAGSEVLSWTVTGKSRAGRPFTLTSANRYASRYDVSMDAGFTLGDIVYELGEIPGITIDSITNDAAFVADSSTYRVTSVQQRVRGSWVAISRRHPGLARAGSRFVARVTLRGAAGQKVVPVSFDVPRRLSGKIAFLSATGGSEIWSEGGFGSLPAARASLERFVRNDEVRASFGTAVYEEEMEGYFEEVFGFRGQRARGYQSTKVVGRSDHVVRGNALAPVMVR